MADPVAPNSDQIERLNQAVLAKAHRLWALGDAPLGTQGSMTEFGVARVMPDHQISELLAGLRQVNWDTDLEDVTTTDLLNEIGYETEEEDLPAYIEDKLERILAAARSWVADEILYGIPL